MDATFLTSLALIIATDLPISTLNILNTGARFSGVPFYAAGAHGVYGYVFADLITHDYTVTRAASGIPTQIGPETPTRSIISSTVSRDTNGNNGKGSNVETLVKREVYQPLILGNSSPLPPPKLTRRGLRSVSPLLPCLRALWEFESISGGRGPASSPELATFTKLATDKTKELQLPKEFLKADFLKAFLQNQYAEIAPTCAFLGGALAQDAVNVIGKREQPMQNMLLFDGEQGKGDCIALYPLFPSNTDYAAV